MSREITTLNEAWTILTEAPDEFGATEDEIDAEYEKELAALQARKAARLADREKAQADKAAEEERKAAEDAQYAEQKKVLEDEATKASELLDSEEFQTADIEDQLQMLFDLCVPADGAARSTAGELIRAINRVMYRDYNDGDVFYFGYGAETAGPAMAFIYDKCPSLQHEIESMAETMPDDEGDVDGYSEWLHSLAEGIIDILNSNRNLFKEINKDDIFNYKWEDEMKFEYEPDISGEYIDNMLDDDFIDWRDIRDVVDEIVEGNFRRAYTNWWARDAVTIENLSWDDYYECKENFESWFYDWVDEKYEEYSNQLEDEEEEER